MLSVLLLAAPAWAHRPHTVITAVAASSEYDRTGRAWMVFDPNRVSMLLRTDDFGRHWDFVGGPPTDDILSDGAYDGDSVVFLAEAGALWTSPDEGASWARAAFAPAGAGTAYDLHVTEGRFVATTDAGVYTGTLADPTAAVAAETGTAFVSAALSGAEDELVSAIAEDGTAWRSEDGGRTFTALSAPPAGARATATAFLGSRQLVGTDAGMLWWDTANSAWTGCGALPVPDESYARYVVQILAPGDGKIYVATGLHALFVSDDDCASWTLRDVGPDMTPEYGGVGNARSPRDAYRGLAVSGDALLVAGFNGVAASEDDGASWIVPTFEFADYLRGVSLAPGFPTDPRLWVGLYGGGAAWTADGGETWSGSSVGILDPHSYDVSTAGDLATSGVLLYAGVSDGYRTTDFGATWTPIEVPVERIRIFPEYGGRFYGLGEESDRGVNGRVVRSTDAGETWETFPALDEALVGAAPRDLVETRLDGRPLILVATDSDPGLVGSFDDGATWTWFYREDGQDLGAGGATWPADDPTRLVYASTTAGVLLSDDLGETWRAPSTPPAYVPRSLLATDDGTLFIGARAGAVLRSTDGGETWEEVLAPLPVAIHDMAAAEDFATTGIAMVGTQGGVYYTRDHGDTWQLLPRYERYEDQTHHLQCHTSAGADCALYADATHGYGGGYALQIGDTLTVNVTGARVRLFGPVYGDGAVDVTVNGVAAGTLYAEGEVLEVDLTGYGAGWKDVAFTAAAVGPDGFRIDGVEVFHDNGVPLFADPIDTGDPGDSGDTATDTGAGDTADGDPAYRCAGCTPGAPTAALLLPALAFAVRRRRVR